MIKATRGRLIAENIQTYRSIGYQFYERDVDQRLSTGFFLAFSYAMAVFDLSPVELCL